MFHDFLWDASHLSYVHLGSLDNGGIAAAKYKIEEEGQSIFLRREEPGVCYEEPLASFFGCKPGLKYNRVHTTEAYMPSIHIAKQCMQEADDFDVPPSLMCATNASTPRDSRTTPAFHAMVSK